MSHSASSLKKTAPKALRALLVAAGIAALAPAAGAATYTWQVAGPTNNWNTTDANWFVDGGSTGTAWTDGNAAVFNAAGETVTVPGTVLPGSLEVRSGAWTFSGGTINSLGGNLISGGTLTVASSFVNSASNSFVVKNGAKLVFGKTDFAGASGIAAAVNLTIEKGGTIDTTGNFYNTFNDLNLSGGTLNASGGANVNYRTYNFKGNINVTGDTTSVISSSGANSGIALRQGGAGTLLFNVADGAAATDLLVSGVLYGQGFEKRGAGTMVLTGANIYSGVTTVTDGILQLGDGTNNTARLGAGGDVIVNAGGQLVYNLNGTTELETILGTGRKLTGNGTFVKVGAAGTVLNISRPVSELNGITNTEVRGGTLQLNAYTGSGTSVGVGQVGALSGTITLFPGTVLKTTVANAMGYASGQKVDALIINDAEWINTGTGNTGWGLTLTLSKAKITISGGDLTFGGATTTDSSINVNTLGPAAQSIITGQINFRTENGQVNKVFNVETGTDPVDLLLQGSIGLGSGANLIKNGSGVMKVNDTAIAYNGATVLNKGTLLFSNVAPTASTQFVVNSGLMEFAGGAPNGAATYTINNGIMKFSGASSAPTAGTGRIAINIEDNPAALGSRGMQILSGNAPIFGGLSMIPGATLSLSKNAANYTDTTNVNILTLTGTAGSSAAGRPKQTGVAPATDIYGSLKLTGNHSLSVGDVGSYDTLTVSNTLDLAGSTLLITIGESGKNDLITSSQLNLSGTNTISLCSITGKLNAGDSYDIFKYDTSSPNPISPANLAVASNLGHFDVATSPGTVRLIIDATNKDLYWRGISGNNSWNITETNLNWNNLGNGRNDFFTDLDKVTFGSGAAPEVLITSDVQPILIVVSNDSSTPYVFRNTTGSITGTSTSLNKTGDGTLTLTSNNAAKLNSFGGAFRISQGTVELNDNGTAGVLLIGNANQNSLLGNGSGGAGNLIIENNAKLLFKGTATNVNSNRTFTIGSGGATLETGNATANLIYFGGTTPIAHIGTDNRTLTLTGTGGRNIIVNSNGATGGVLTQRLTDPAGGGKLTVVKEGTGVWSLQGNNTFTGGLIIRGEPGVSGMLAFNNDVALGAVPTSPVADAIILDGGNLFGATSTSGNIYGAAVSPTISKNRGITLTQKGAGVRVWGGQSITIESTITDASGAAGSLSKWDDGALILKGENTYKGGTTITAGKIQTANVSALGKGNLNLKVAGAILGIIDKDIEVAELSGEGVVQVDTSNLEANLILHSTNPDPANVFKGTLINGVGILGLRKTGSETAVLDGGNENTFTGNVIVENGILKAAKQNPAHAALGKGPSLGVLAGGTLDLNSSENITGTTAAGKIRTIFLNGTGYNGKGALTSAGESGAANRTVDNIYTYGENALITIGNPTSLTIGKITSLTPGMTPSNVVIPTDISGRIVPAATPQNLTFGTTEPNRLGKIIISDTVAGAGIDITGQLTVNTTVEISSETNSVKLGSSLAKPDLALTIGATNGNLVLLNDNILPGTIIPDINPGNHLTLGTFSTGTAISQTLGGLIGLGTVTHGADTDTANSATLILNTTATTAAPDAGTLFSGKIGTNATAAAGSAQISLIKRGTGIMVLAGLTNDYTGKTRIEEGILEIQAPMTAPNGAPYGVLGIPDPASTDSIIYIASGATLRHNGISADSITTRNLAFGGGGSAQGITIEANGLKSFQFAGTDLVTHETADNVKLVLTGTGTNPNNLFAPTLEDSGSYTTSLEKTGTGEWTLGATGTANTYTGGTTVKNGTLSLGTNNAITANTKLTLGDTGTAAKLKLDGHIQTLSKLTAIGNSLVINATTTGKAYGTLELNTAPAATPDRYTGSLGVGTDPGNTANQFHLTKNGTGTLELTGSATHAGDTKVNAGLLTLIGDATTTISKNIAVATGAQLKTIGNQNPDNTYAAASLIMGHYGSLTGTQTLSAGDATQNTATQLLGSYTIANNGVLRIGDTYLDNNTYKPEIAWLNIGDNGDGRTGQLNLNGGKIIYTLAADSAKENNDLIHVDKLTITKKTTVESFLKDGRLAPGKYLLLTYDTLAPGSNIANLTYNQTGSRYITTIEQGTDGRSIWLNVQVDDNNQGIYWAGQTGNQWGDGTATGATNPGNPSNFRNTNAANDTGFISYGPGDTAIFDDTGVNTNIVIADGGVQIGRIRVESNKDYTFSGGSIDDSLTGTHYIEKSGNGTLTLASANTYSGGTYITGGAVLVKHSHSLGAGTAYLQGGTLAVNGNLTIANDLSITDAGGTLSTQDTPTLTGKLQGNATLKKDDYGTLRLANPDGAAFTGTLNIANGGIQLDAPADYSAATFDLTGNTTTLTAAFLDGQTAKIGSLAGTATTAKVKADGTGTLTLEIGAKNENTTYAGTLADGTATLALTKVGTGTLILSADNTNTGTLNVKAGTLQIGNGNTAGTLSGTTANITAGATLAFNKSTETTLSQTINSAGTLAQLGTGTLYITNDNTTLAGTVAIANGATLQVGQKDGTGTTGTLGTAQIDNNGTLIYNRQDPILTIANTITGTGDIVKNGNNTLLYTGNNLSTGTTYINTGTLQIGDTTLTAPQTYNSAAIYIAGGATLDLVPGDTAPLTLASAITAIDSVINKTGTGTVILTGNNTASGTFNVTNGTLQIGDGTDKGGLTGILDLVLAPTANLVFNRAGTTNITATITGGPHGTEPTGNILQTGGGTVILSGNNNINGLISVGANSTLQVGDGTSGRLLNPNDPAATIAIDLTAGSTLAYNINKDPASTKTDTTPPALTITGEGNFEQRGQGTLLLASKAHYTGNTIASTGRLIIPTDNLPAGYTDPDTDPARGYLEARDGATIQLQHNTPDTPFTLEGRIRGAGTIALGTTAATARYTYNTNNNNTIGILAVEDKVTLDLGTNPAAKINAQRVEIRAGGTLTGQATTHGHLYNLTDGTLTPGNSTGTITVTGDFVNQGKLILEITGTGTTYAYDCIKYAGNATIDGTNITYDLTNIAPETIAHLKANSTVIHIIESTAGNTPQTANLARPSPDTFVYNDGIRGVALIFAESIADIPGVAAGLHDGLNDYVAALNTLPPASTLIGDLLSAPDQAQAVNNASPLGYASMTAMSITSAHDAAATLRTHLEALRYEHARTGTPIDLAPYITVTGIMVDNGTGRSTPTYDFNTYGALVGLDHSITKELLVGINAGYSHGKADFHHNGGNVKQDTARVQFYGTYMINDWVYLDASAFIGYSSYDTTHNTVAGKATGDSTGFDAGFNAYIGTIAPLTKTVHLTPYLGLEYVHADVDGFNEDNSAMALTVDGFTQDSLRAKIGTGLNWIALTGTDYTLRLGLDAAYAHELLDSEADITARFRAGSNKFKVTAAAIPEDSLMIGPQIEFGFDGNKSINLGYTFEYDLDSQYIHHLNASFRMRF